MPQGGNTGLVGGQTPDRSGEEIILSTLRRRWVERMISSPLKSGVCPPTSPVLPPCGVIGARASAQAATAADTSAVLAGRTSAILLMR